MKIEVFTNTEKLRFERIGRILFLGIFLIASQFSYAQNTTKKLGLIIDRQTHLPLLGVKVSLYGSLQSTTTDTNGFFELIIPKSQTVLSCVQLGYEDAFVQLKEGINDTLKIEMIPKVTVLEEFVVSERQVENITKKRYSVLDYELMNQNILLIAFRFNVADANLVLLNPRFDTLSMLTVPEKPERLYKDCMGNNHLVCKDHVYQVYFDSKELLLFPPVKRELFEKQLFPCVASDEKQLYFIDKKGSREVALNKFDVQTHNYQLNYFSLSRINKHRTNLTAIVDEATANMSKDEQSYLDNKEKNGFYRVGIMKDFDRIFSETVLFKEIFAPLIVSRDTVYVFDFINSKIHRFKEGKELSFSGMKFHSDNLSWKRELLVDRTKNKVFSIYEVDGKRELREVNMDNGNLVKSHSLPYLFAEKYIVNDGFVYFLYKEVGSNFKVLSRYQLRN